MDSDKHNGEVEENGSEDTPSPQAQGEGVESEGGEGVLEVSRVRGSPVPKGSLEVEEERIPAVPGVPEVRDGGVREEENEFILDGFDFSTGLR